jgi:hypothetical protein
MVSLVSLLDHGQIEVCWCVHIYMLSSYDDEYEEVLSMCNVHF